MKDLARSGSTDDRSRASSEGDPASGSSRPPSPGDLAWAAAIGIVKAAVIALAVNAYINSDGPRLRGKAMKVRAVGYVASLLVVPLVWRLRGGGTKYPRGLDLAVAIPMLADAGGNAVGVYQRAHVDDAIHFANGALLASVIGDVATPRTRTAWEAAGVALAAGTSAGAWWEIAEWVGLKLGAKGMALSYDDTMGDLIETSTGALVGALITLLRHPASLKRVPGQRGDPIVRGGSGRVGDAGP